MSFGRRICACCSLTVHGLIFFNGFAFLFTPFISSAACDLLFAVVVCIDAWPLLLVRLFSQTPPSFGLGICALFLGWFVIDCGVAAIIHSAVAARGIDRRA